MRLQKAVLALTSVVVLHTTLMAQGCDMLLRDGVFNTFNQNGARYGYDQWHQAWCSKTLSRSSGSTSTSAGIDVLLGEIPLGLSFGDASEFQRMYQAEFCGNADRTRVDFTQRSIIQKTADPSLIAGYTQCKSVENAGLVTTFANDAANPRAFLVSMRWVPQVPSDAQIQVVTFSPGGVTCQGNLSAGGTLRANTSKTMLCTRSTDGAVTATIGSNAGVFYRTLAAITPPPSDQDRVMGALPRGTVLGWSNKVPVPRGWQICDGSNGTPDLNRRYLVGTSSPDSVGRNTGNEWHTHRIAGSADGFHLLGYNPPTSFVHNSNGTSSNSFQSHGHTLDFTSDAASSRGPGANLMFIMKL